jgi:hypothetical protein
MSISLDVDAAEGATAAAAMLALGMRVGIASSRTAALRVGRGLASGRASLPTPSTERRPRLAPSPTMSAARPAERTARRSRTPSGT